MIGGVVDALCFSAVGDYKLGSGSVMKPASTSTTDSVGWLALSAGVLDIGCVMCGR